MVPTERRAVKPHPGGTSGLIRPETTLLLLLFISLEIQTTNDYILLPHITMRRLESCFRSLDRLDIVGGVIVLHFDVSSGNGKMTFDTEKSWDRQRPLNLIELWNNFWFVPFVALTHASHAENRLADGIDWNSGVRRRREFQSATAVTRDRFLTRSATEFRRFESCRLP